MRTIQDRNPNFRDEDDNLFLIRCFACSSTAYGRENYATYVATGQCAWCGWKETVSSHDKMHTQMLNNEEIDMESNARKLHKTVNINGGNNHIKVKIFTRSEDSYFARCDGFDGEASGKSAAEALGNFLILIEKVDNITHKSLEDNIIKAAIELRDSGYDGPFIGEVCVPLFTAIADYETAIKS